MFLSNSDRAAKHQAHMEIIRMGLPVVPLIMERMRETLEGKRETGGHWFHALRDITGANPVKHTERGNVPAMQEAWLEWGERSGYA